MPPRGTSPEAGRGRGGRGGGRGGRGGFRGGIRGGIRGGDDRGSGRGRGRGDRGAGRSSGGGNRGRGRGAGGPSGATPSYGPQLTSHREVLPPLVDHIKAIGEERTSYGTGAERLVRVTTNHVGVELDQGTIYHYDVILPEGNRRMERNYQIIQALQTEVEDRLFTRPGVYDGQRNFFTSFDLEYEDGAREYVVPMGPNEFKVRLTYVASINPEVLERFVQRQQDHDNPVDTAIMALNVVIRMKPVQIYPFNKRSFFADREPPKDIGGGIELWRGYFQSVRPAMNRMLINVDVATGPMYRPGPLIELALEFLGKPGRSANTLAPRHGFPDRERMHLQHFLSGLKVTTPHNEHDQTRQRLVKKLTRLGSRDLEFPIADDQSMTVADYFQARLNGPLRFPDVICVELSTRAWIPLELCIVPPGQIVHKQMSQDQINSILNFSSMRPNERCRSVRNALNVLEYGQSEYVRQFGMRISNNLLDLEARVFKPPVLNYHPESRQPRVELDPGKSTWNMIDKLMYQPSTIPSWILVIYETERRFRKEIAEQMVANLVEGGRSVGIFINPRPLMKWESGQGIIANQLRAACNLCRRRSGNAPTLIVVVLPEGGNDIYTAVKNFGDVSDGIPTQCMKSAKCFRAKSQYFANVLLKINVRLGGINVVPEQQDISFLADPAHPTMVMGGDITHAPPGSKGKPSFTALIGSIDRNAVQYVSKMGAQRSPREIIEDLEDMCVHLFKEFKEARNTYPERILFYRDGVSEGEFATIIEEEIVYIRNACHALGFSPTITFIVVRKKHKVVFFPTSRDDSDSSGNCLPGMVVDTDITNPIENDYFLLSHSGILGTSKPAHYNVLLDENGFTADGIQRLSYALCYVYARCTRSVSLPAPIFYAHNVCMRAKNHYDPQLRHEVFLSETATETTDPSGSTSESEIRGGFQPTNERMAKLMYFI